MLDAGSAVELAALSIVSDTPGFTADVKAGASSDGPFDTVSGSQTVGRNTTFRLTCRRRGATTCVWITRLAPGYARTDVSEVTAAG